VRESEDDRGRSGSVGARANPQGALGGAQRGGGAPEGARGGLEGRSRRALFRGSIRTDLSAGLRMRKEHMRLSSTAMTAPALSNSPQ